MMRINCKMKYDGELPSIPSGKPTILRFCRLDRFIQVSENHGCLNNLQHGSSCQASQSLRLIWTWPNSWAWLRKELAAIPGKPSTTYWWTEQSPRTARPCRPTWALPGLTTRKAYDSIPHTWILECLEIYINRTLRSFIKNSMGLWKTTLEANKKWLHKLPSNVAYTKVMHYPHCCSA